MLQRAVQPGTLPELPERPTAAEARQWLVAQRAALKDSFFAHPDPRKLLALHAKIVDHLLARLWKTLFAYQFTVIARPEALS